jgi:hypothetical protein
MNLKAINRPIVQIGDIALATFQIGQKTIYYL